MKRDRCGGNSLHIGQAQPVESEWAGRMTLPTWAMGGGVRPVRCWPRGQLIRGCDWRLRNPVMCQASGCGVSRLTSTGAAPTRRASSLCSHARTVRATATTDAKNAWVKWFISSQSTSGGTGRLSSCSQGWHSVATICWSNSSVPFVLSHSSAALRPPLALLDLKTSFLIIRAHTLPFFSGSRALLLLPLFAPPR